MIQQGTCYSSDTDVAVWAEQLLNSDNFVGINVCRKSFATSLEEEMRHPSHVYYLGSSNFCLLYQHVELETRILWCLNGRIGNIYKCVHWYCGKTTSILAKVFMGFKPVKKLFIFSLQEQRGHPLWMLLFCDSWSWKRRSLDLFWKLREK